MTATPLNNAMVKYDFFLKLGTSVIMPILLSLGTALIVNWFQTKQKDKEYEQALKKLDKQNEYDLTINRLNNEYLSVRDSFAEMIKTVGDFLGDIDNDEKHALAMSSITKNRLLADQELASQLSFLLIQIGAFRNSLECRETNTVETQNSLMEVAECMKKQLDNKRI